MPIPLFGSQMVSELSHADFNWRRLQRLAKLTFTERQKETLLTHFNSFLIDFAREQSSPHEEDVGRLLKGYAESAHALDLLMQDRSVAGETALSLALVHYLGDIAAFRHAISAVASDASYALESLPRKAGKPREKALPDLIRGWHATYREAGGTGLGCSWSEAKGKFEGKFLFLVYLALQQGAKALTSRKDPLGLQIRRSRSGLAQAIKKALKRQR
jgi:hypothetical protein